MDARSPYRAGNHTFKEEDRAVQPKAEREMGGLMEKRKSSLVTSSCRSRCCFIFATFYNLSINQKKKKKKEIEKEPEEKSAGCS